MARTSAFCRLHLYGIQEHGANNIKFGRTLDVSRRLAEIRTSCPNEVTLVMLAEEAGWLEETVHRAFLGHRINREWFRCDGAVADFLEGVRRRMRWRREITSNPHALPTEVDVLIELGVACGGVADTSTVTRWEDLP